ncbi:MAG: DUF935 family protein [Opitutales bacterium]
MSAVRRSIIRPHVRDHQLSPIPVDFEPDTLGWLLEEGARGNLLLQNELFNAMEDTWDRLRGNLNKLKQAVCKLPFDLQPWTEKGRKPLASALEKAAFVEHVLHNQRAATWEGQHNFHATIYELLDAVARGVAVLEIDWTVEDGRYLPVGTRRVPWTCLGFEQARQLGPRSDPGALRLFPDRNPHAPRRFAEFPHKFLVGVYRAKSGHLAETAQLRSLAHLWLGRMLGWEWMTAKAELFGLPVRWATYDPAAPQQQIDQISDMLRNMGTAAWGAFPQGTDLQILNGNTPGVAGTAEPTERLMFLADRACDLLFLGQTLTSEEGARNGSYALGNVHREVELDLYENYASYVVDVLNNQLIPSIVALNWGTPDEVPFLEVELDRPGKDHQTAERDKLLFQEMGLPVSKQWLYDRHKVPAPGPEEDLFDPLPPYLSDRREVAMQRNHRPEAEGSAQPPGKPGREATPAEEEPTRASAHECSCTKPLGFRISDFGFPEATQAASESTESLNRRQAAARTELNRLLESITPATEELVWTSGDCPVCRPFNGTKYGTGWRTPPPLHHNCDCRIEVRRRG